MHVLAVWDGGWVSAALTGGGQEANSTGLSAKVRGFGLFRGGRADADTGGMPSMNHRFSVQLARFSPLTLRL